MTHFWNRLTGALPERPLTRVLLVAVALAVLAAAALGVTHLVRSPAPEPNPPDTASPGEVPTGAAESSADRRRVLLPFLMGSNPTRAPAPEATPTPAPTSEPARPTATPTPEPVDFAAVREELRAGGQDLAYVKIGFHAGPGGNARGLGEYLSGLASAGVPAVVKSVDAYGVCAETLQASPDNVTVFRMSGGGLELPDYERPAGSAAEEHWARVLEALPPEFDQRTWIEVMNEPDKSRADWLGHCAYRLGELALRDGYKLAAFGWSSGEPEPADWRVPGMQAYLSLAAQHPERLAVALHEYSYNVENIANQYPSLVGRFQTLFQACDEMGIERPTVLITEWGWEAERLPGVDQAMADIAWAAQLYGAYPQVRGAALWYLGSGYGGIADRAQRLILPMWYYAWSEYFVIEPGQKPTDPSLFAPQ